MKGNILNHCKLEEWREIDSLNWRQIAGEILVSFFDISNGLSEQIQTAWSIKNFAGVGYAAHTLKSACGNVGAERAYYILDSIESAANSKNVEELSQLIESFNEIFPETCKNLEEYKRQFQAA